MTIVLCRLLSALVLYLTTLAAGAVGTPFLAGLKHRNMIASTDPANGDRNPYAVVVSPVSSGRLVPRNLGPSLGGVGLTTAMAVLRAEVVERGGVKVFEGTGTLTDARAGGSGVGAVP